MIAALAVVLVFTAGMVISFLVARSVKDAEGV